MTLMHICQEHEKPFSTRVVPVRAIFWVCHNHGNVVLAYSLRGSHHNFIHFEEYRRLTAVAKGVIRKDVDQVLVFSKPELIQPYEKQTVESIDALLATLSLEPNNYDILFGEEYKRHHH